MLPTARKLAFTDVPVIDLAPVWSGDAKARARVADEIAEACGRVGFFYVKNHGLSDADIAAIFETSADFHDLPHDAKMEVSVTKNNHSQGYLHGMTKGNDKSIAENMQEAFQIKRPLADDDPDLLAGRPLHGKIPWPSAMPDLKPRMMAYYDKVNVLGYELLALFELALGLKPGDLKQYFKKDMNSLRLLHYPPQKPDEEGVHLGARAHTDTNAFTILAQDNNGGLEVRNLENEWVAVPPVDGTLVVNVGEVLKVWSDGVFSSTLHRVINRSGRRRYSIPFFMYPSYDALIHPLLKNPDPANVAPENLHTSMPRDKPFVYGEFKSRHTAKIMPGNVKTAEAAKADAQGELSVAAYVIGEAEITNPEAMKAYGPMIVAAVKKYGGKYLARGARPQVLEGGPAHNILIIEFENAAAARAWYASPEYQAAKAVRQGHSHLRLILVEDFVKPPSP